LIRSLPRLDERALVFLDLAATAPTLAVLAGGVPRLVRTLPLPGGADASRLAAEIRLTLAAGGAGTCGGVLLAGGGPAVRVALGRELGTSVTSLGDVEIPGVPAALRSEQGRFAVALGLALAPLRDPGAGVGFPLAPAAASRRRLRSEMARARALVAAAALAALLHAGVGYGVAWHRTRALARALDARLDTLSAAGADAASVDALRHTVARLRRAAASRGRSPTLEVLREVSARIPPGADVVVEGLSLRASLLTLCGTAADAEAAAAVAEDLRASGLLRHVHLDEVTRRADRVTFVLRAAADT
jgi:Tfp pilus assembly protein PilN